MRIGPNVTDNLPKELWLKGEPPPALFDPGEVTFSPQAVEDMRYLDMHPGEILAIHVSGKWKYDDRNTVARNHSNLRRGVVAVESTAIWSWRRNKTEKKSYFYFHTHTANGKTHVRSSLDLIV